VLNNIGERAQGPNMARDSGLIILGTDTTHQERGNGCKRVAWQDVNCLRYIAAGAAWIHTVQKGKQPMADRHKSQKKHEVANRGPHSKDLVTEIAADRTQTRYGGGHEEPTRRHVKELDRIDRT